MNTSYFLTIYSASLNSSFNNSYVADLIFLGIMTIDYLEESVKGEGYLMFKLYTNIHAHHTTSQYSSKWNTQ